jgi:hypothetical protein
MLFGNYTIKIYYWTAEFQRPYRSYFLPQVVQPVELGCFTGASVTSTVTFPVSSTTGSRAAGDVSSAVCSNLLPRINGTSWVPVDFHAHIIADIAHCEVTAIVNYLSTNCGEVADFACAVVAVQAAQRSDHCQ